MNLLHEDIFGVASEMKAAASNRKSNMKEAMGAKTYESIEILSSLIMFKPSQMKGWDGKGTFLPLFTLFVSLYLKGCDIPLFLKSQLAK